MCSRIYLLRSYRKNVDTAFVRQHNVMKSNLALSLKKKVYN